MPNTSLLQLIQRYGLIALMLFVLAGVQVLQASPLHDHAQHSVDCGLCHVPLADDPAAQSSSVPDLRRASAPLPARLAHFCGDTSPSPYQGRAPPPLLS
jgi:hypothetical protein